MATQIGVIKQVSGLVVAVDENGAQRVLKAGDALFLGEVIKTSSAASKAVVSMDNGKDVTILGNESVKLDNSVLANSDNTVADVSDLQKALLDGKDLTKLEETAAGGGNAAAGGGDGVSLGAASFDEGGHYSNISENFRSLGDLNSATGAERIGGVSGGASGGIAGTGADIDTTPANKPTIDPINNDDTKVTGKVENPEKDTTVTVTFPDGQTATTTVDNNGNWEVPTSGHTIKPGDTVTATAEDHGGKSGEANSEVGDHTPANKPTIDPINNDDTKVTGKVENPEKDTTVTVTFPDGQTATTTVDNNGNWEVPTSGHTIKPGDTVTATAEDHGGKSGEANSEVGDHTPANKPTIDPINNDDTKVTGKVENPEKDTTVTVTFPDGQTATTTVDNNGNWEVPTSGHTIKPGDTVTATAEDHGGKSGEANSEVGDHTPANKPTIDPINNDDTKVTGKVENPEKDTTVTVTFPDGQTATTTVDNNGNWEVPTSGHTIKPGDTVTATAEDHGGKSGEANSEVGDHTPANKPTIDPINNDDTKVTGKVENPEKDTTVTVTFPDGQTATTTVDNNGNWEVPTSGHTIKPGDTVTATAEDHGGKSGEANSEVGDHTPANKPTIDPINNDDTKVTGKVENPEKDTTVTVTFPDGQTATTTVDNNGNWEVPTSGHTIKPGDTVTATAEDHGGKSGEANSEVGDHTPANKPTIDPINNDDTKVTGKVENPEKDTTVTVTFPDGQTATTTVDNNGNWEVPTSGHTIKPGDTVTATAEDHGGKSGEANSEVGDHTPANKPTIDPINNDDTKVTGKVENPEKDTTVTVTFPDGQTATTTVDNNGNWEVPTSGHTIKPGDTVTATAEDHGGKSGEANSEVGDHTPANKPTIDPINNDDTKVTGKVENPEKDTTVTVTFPDGQTATTTVDNNGNWEVPTSGHTIKPGDTVTATAEDHGGKSGEANSEVGDHTPANKPTIDPINNDDTKVTGKVENPEKDTTVTVTFPDGSTATTTVDNNGNWEVPTSGHTIKPGDTVTATAEDHGGKSGEANSEVGDHTPANKPTIDPINNDDTKVTGKVENPEKDTTVTVTFPDGQTATTTVDNNGNWEVPTSGHTIKPGDTVTATAEDHGGKSGEANSEVGDHTPANKPTIDPINNDDTKVTGKVENPEKDTTVTVTFPDGQTATTTVDNNGNWEVPTSGHTIKPGDTVTATAEDHGGKSGEANSEVGDHTPANKPTIDPINNDDTKVTGKVENPEKDTTVTVTFPDGQTATTTVDNNGNWEVPTSGHTIKPGDTVTATAEDHGGKSGEANSEVGDHTPANKPTIDPINNDDTKVTGKVENPEKDTTVTVTFPDGQTATTTVDNNGNWEVPTSGHTIKPGDTVTATAEDHGGKSGEANSEVGDHTPANKPTIDPINNDDTKVTGKVENPEKDTTVTVTFPDGQTATTTVDNNGNWEVPTSGHTIKPGDTVTATAEDHGGKSGEANSEVGDHTPANKPTIDPINNDDTKVTGKVENPEKDTTVTVTFPDGQTATTTVDNNGNWEVPTSGHTIKPGDTVTATAEDHGGKSGEANSEVGDHTPANKPTIDPINNDDTKVTGKVENPEKDTTVTVTFPDGQTATTTVDNNGNWEVPTSGHTIKPGDTVTATAEDHGGKSGEANSEVGDHTPANKPTIDPINNDDTKVTGKVENPEKDTTVTVTFPDGQTATTTVDNNGNWEVPTSGHTIKPGDTVTATAEDHGGKSGEANSEVGDHTPANKPTIDPINNDDTKVTGKVENPEKDTTVTVTFPDGQTATTTVDNNGNWEVPTSGHTIKPGDTVTATAEDHGGKSGEANSEVGDHTPANKPTIDPINNDDTKVTGKVENPEKDTTVTVTFPDGQTATTTVDNNGNWEVPTSGHTIKPGDTVTATAEDHGGKSGEANSEVGDHTPANKPTIDPINNDDTKVTGKVENPEKDTTVTVTFPDGQTATTTVDNNGNWEVPTSGHTIKPGDTVTATAEDHGGKSGEANSEVGDHTPANKPTIDPINNDDTKVTGKVENPEKDTTVTVTFPDGQTATTTVDNNGNWEVPTSGHTIKPGDTVTATAEDHGGKSGEANSEVGDHTPANKPTIDPINNDDTKVTGKVENPEKDTTVTVTFPDGQTATTTVDNNGNWEVPTSGHTIKPGDTVTATAEDHGGKSGEANSEVGDHTPANKPTIDPINNDDTKVTGKVENPEKDTTVTVTFPDGQTATTTVDNNGNWEVPTSGHTIKPGDTVTATAEDHGGKSGEANSEVGDHTPANKPTIDPINNDDTKVTGKVENPEKDTTVTVTFPDGQTATTTVDNNGNWEVPTSGHTIKPGDTVTATAEDHGGKSGEANSEVGDHTPANKPTIDPINNDDTKVTGKVENPEKDTTVTVTFPDGQTATTTVDNNGNWEVPTSGHTIKPGDTVTATAEDHGGKSGEANSEVGDHTPANKPTIDPINNDDTKVTGKVENPEKDTTVTVTFPDGQTATTTVDNNGNWEVPTSGHTIKPGDTVTATAEDHGGKSDPVNSEVVDVTIGTIEARFVEDGNNDGRLTYQENMSDGNRKSTSLELKVSGSFEDGDKITLHLDDPIKGSGDIVLKKVGNSAVVESASESLKGMAPIGAAAPINNGVIMISKIGMLNGQKTIAKAYITDDAGNKSNVATDEFTYVDRESKPVNVNAGSAIYGSFGLGILLDPNKVKDTELQPLIGGNDDHSLKVKTITTDANIRFGDGDDNIVVQNLPGKGGFGNILNNSVVNLGAGDNKLEVERDIDKSKIIAGDGDDTVTVHHWVRADATIDLGAGDNKLTVDDQIFDSTVTTKGGNDEVSTHGLVGATINLGDGDNKLSVETNAVTGSKITTGSGDDTIEIGKNVINSTINLGGGDDTIKVGWLGNNKNIDGGEGHDTLALTNSGKTIDLSHIAKQAHNFEEINISNGKADATLKVSLKDVVDLTDEDNILKISGDKDDAVSFKDANQWIKGTSANGYTSYTGSFEGKTVTVQIEDEIKQPM